MKQTTLSILVINILLLVVASGSGQDHRHQRVSPESYERPGRDAWQKPQEVVHALKLRPTDVVADIGAGSGYFTRCRRSTGRSRGRRQSAGNRNRIDPAESQTQEKIGTGLQALHRCSITICYRWFPKHLRPR
jgi:hypothetical protein